jgi:hypothetical protein
MWTQEPAQQQAPAQQTPAQEQSPAQQNTPAEGQQPAATQSTEQAPAQTPAGDATQTQPADANQAQQAPATQTDEPAPPPKFASPIGIASIPTAAKPGKPAAKNPNQKKGLKDAENTAETDPDGEALIDAGPFSEPEAGEEGGKKSRRTTDITEEELKSLLLKKELYLRGGYLNDTLSFNEHGGLVGKSPTGSYTLSSVEITHISMTKHKIILSGDRYGLHFLGNVGEDPDKNIAMIKLTPPKKKKPLTISIDREVVVKPPKEKVVKAPKAKVVKGKGKGGAGKPGIAANGVPCAAPASTTAAPATSPDTAAPTPDTAAPATTPTDGITAAPTAPAAEGTAAQTTPPADGSASAQTAPPADGTTAAPATEGAPTTAPAEGTAAATQTPTPAATQTSAQTAPPCEPKPAEETVAATPAPEEKPAEAAVAAKPGEAQEPDLSPEEQAKAEVAASIAAAKPEERPADPNSVTHTYSAVHSSRVLRQALDKIFSVGLDSREMESLPDMWKHYFEAQANRAFYRFQDPSLVKLSEVDTKPRMLKGVEPLSNQYAQENGIVGIARYRAVIGADGKAGDIAITVPIGFGLDENAATAIRAAEYKPATKNGQPVSTVIDLFITFRIFSKLTAPTPGKKEDTGVEIAPAKPAPKPGPYTLIHPSGQVAPALPAQTPTAAPEQTPQPAPATQGGVSADTAMPATTTATPATTQPATDTTSAPAEAMPTQKAAPSAKQPAQTMQGAMPTQTVTPSGTKPAANQTTAPAMAVPNQPDASKPAPADWKAPTPALDSKPADTTKPAATDWKAPASDTTKPADTTTPTPAPAPKS